MFLLIFDPCYGRNQSSRLYSFSHYSGLPVFHILHPPYRASGLPSAAPTFPLVSPTLRFFRTWIPRSKRLLFFPLFSSFSSPLLILSPSPLLSSLYYHLTIHTCHCVIDVLRFAFRFAVHLHFSRASDCATTEIRLRIDTWQKAKEI